MTIVAATSTVCGQPTIEDLVRFNHDGRIMAKNEGTQTIRRMWLAWVVASTAGLAVGWPVYVAGQGMMDITLAGYVAGAAGALAAGALQALVLRTVARVGWWVPANVAAVATGAAMIFTVEGVDAGIAVALLGAALGLFQWLVLRRRAGYAGWWVFASAAGWVLGGLASAIASGLIAWALIGAVYGGITGAALVWLLQRPVPIG